MDLLFFFLGGGGGIFLPRLSTLSLEELRKLQVKTEILRKKHVEPHPVQHGFFVKASNFKSGIPLTNISVKGITVEPLGVTLS